MNRSKIHIGCFALVVSLLMGCNNKSPLSIDEEYPTTLYPLNSEQLDQLQNEFDVLNDYKIQAELNEYGLIGGRDYSKIHANPGITITDEKALRIAINALLKNKKFTNATDSLDLLSDVNTIGPNLKDGSLDSTDWNVIFGNQKYSGYEVYNSRLLVDLYADGVYKLDGFWYSDIYIPSDDNFDANEAKEKVIGKSVTWEDGSGNQQSLTIHKKLIIEPYAKAIFPLNKENSIELRVTWKIGIKLREQDAADYSAWDLYLDSSTGEIVSIIQNFRT